MGSFHACRIFLTVIGKRFEFAGLHDLIVEARLSGPESVNQILNGKEYNYGIRICKVIFEALQRAKLDVFEEWVQKEKKSDIFTNFLECEAFTELIKKIESIMFNAYLQSLSALFDAYHEFQRARSLVVSDLRSETKDSRFESGCQLCAEVSSLQ